MSAAQWTFPPQVLEDSPSRRDGISLEVENAYRRKTTVFIEDCARYLQCQELVLVTAFILFQRFFTFQSFRQHDRKIIGIACLLLAAKRDEAPRQLRKIVQAYHAVAFKGRRTSEPEPPEEDTRAKIILAERVVLYTLGFDLQLDHPAQALIQKLVSFKDLVTLQADQLRNLAKTASDFVKDSTRSTLILRYPPAELATAALYLSLRLLNIKPMLTFRGQSRFACWTEFFSQDMSLERLRDIGDKIVDVYEDPKEKQRLLKQLKQHPDFAASIGVPPQIMNRSQAYGYAQEVAVPPPPPSPTASADGAFKPPPPPSPAAVDLKPPPPPPSPAVSDGHPPPPPPSPALHESSSTLACQAPPPPPPSPHLIGEGSIDRPAGAPVQPPPPPSPATPSGFAMAPPPPPTPDMTPDRTRSLQDVVANHGSPSGPEAKRARAETSPLQTVPKRPATGVDEEGEHSQKKAKQF